MPRKSAKAIRLEHQAALFRRLVENPLSREDLDDMAERTQGQLDLWGYAACGHLVDTIRFLRERGYTFHFDNAGPLSVEEAVALTRSRKSHG